MDRPLEGKLALVTGGGTRLGRAIAEGLGRAGAEVAVHFHSSEEGAQAAVRAIQADGNRAGAFQGDLQQPEEVASLAARVEAQLGPISILVNSAAIFERAEFAGTSLEVLERQWRLNARAPFLLTQALAPAMAKRGGGDVINVLDIGGALRPWRHYSAYCMSKAALGSLTQCLALELAPAVRVNGVAPGTVLPPEGLSADELEKLRAQIPQQRFGSPEDIVKAVLFLLTGPSFVTGQILAVDGGRSL